VVTTLIIFLRQFIKIPFHPLPRLKLNSNPL
jgi:hypothetical protein